MSNVIIEGIGTPGPKPLWESDLKLVGMRVDCYCDFGICAGLSITWGIFERFGNHNEEGLKSFLIEISILIVACWKGSYDFQCNRKYKLPLTWLMVTLSGSII